MSIWVEIDLRERFDQFEGNADEVVGRLMALQILRFEYARVRVGSVSRKSNDRVHITMNVRNHELVLVFVYDANAAEIEFLSKMMSRVGHLVREIAFKKIASVHTVVLRTLSSDVFVRIEDSSNDYVFGVVSEIIVSGGSPDDLPRITADSVEEIEFHVKSPPDFDRSLGGVQRLGVLEYKIYRMYYNYDAAMSSFRRLFDDGRASSIVVNFSEYQEHAIDVVRAAMDARGDGDISFTWNYRPLPILESDLRDLEVLLRDRIDVLVMKSMHFNKLVIGRSGPRRILTISSSAYNFTFGPPHRWTRLNEVVFTRHALFDDWFESETMGDMPNLRAIGALAIRDDVFVPSRVMRSIFKIRPSLSIVVDAQSPTSRNPEMVLLALMTPSSLTGAGLRRFQRGDWGPVYRLLIRLMYDVEEDV
jgi:hypothetical protein